MDERYFPETVEREAQAYWDENRAFEVREDPAREKFYCLSMFPYPSGKLHMGHVRNYTIGDVISRYQRMRGRNVLQPMGWDAFGLPAENAAMQNRVPPARWTYRNIEYMKEQLRRLGFAYDWSRELATCRPDYYRWEQWLFTRLFEQGIAYRRESEVNWDPVDRTVLANEQVIDGRGWRSGAFVERRKIPQWFLRITDFAEELLTELDHIDWPDPVKTMQRNWIGRSEGTEIDFEIEGPETEGGDADGGLPPLRVFTTRPDTVYGATFMAVAVEHPLAAKVAERREDVAAFIEECRRGGATAAEIETMEKRGMPLGLDAVNPFNGERLPVWVANFVLMGYGTGAIMAVPGHDERDPRVRAPARAADPAGDRTRGRHGVGHPGRSVDGQGGHRRRRFRRILRARLPRVLRPDGGLAGTDRARRAPGELSAARLGRLAPALLGLPGPHRALRRLRDGPGARRAAPGPAPRGRGRRGRRLATGPAPGVRGDRLPEVRSGRPPRHRHLRHVHGVVLVLCAFLLRRRRCLEDRRTRRLLDAGRPVHRGHRARHPAPDVRALLPEADERGGLTKVREPFSSLLTQGMVVAETFYRDADGHIRYYAPAEVQVEHDARGKITGARARSDGAPVEVGPIEKMSKSKNNGVDPEDMIARYGADTVRLYIIETSPPDQMLEWSGSAVEGASRFLRRLWRTVREHVGQGPAPTLDVNRLDGPARELRCRIHETIAKVGDDVGRRYKFNTACAACRELVNDVIAFEAGASDTGGGMRRSVVREALEAVVLMLAPVIPHVCHTLWRSLGHRDPVIDAAWPVADEAAMSRDVIELVVQVNGKLRGHVSVGADADREAVEREAQRNDNVARFIGGKPVRKVIVVPGRLVNIVV